MGLYSDILEHNRDHALYDICLMIPQSQHLGNDWIHSSRIRLSQSEHTRQVERQQQAFFLQAKHLLSAKTYKDVYESSLWLLNQCVSRENQLLSLIRNNKFVTHIVRDAINEYISKVRFSMKYAEDNLREAKQHLETIPSYSERSNEVPDMDIILYTLLDNIFIFLTEVAEFDDSQFLQELFLDVSLLIKHFDEYKGVTKKPKEICRDYYERNFNPTKGIETCDNCGAKLYNECSYCFNCFERSISNDR